MTVEDRLQKRRRQDDRMESFRLILLAVIRFMQWAVLWFSMEIMSLIMMSFMRPEGEPKQIFFSMLHQQEWGIIFTPWVLAGFKLFSIMRKDLPN